MSVEFEVKYSATAEVLEAIQKAFPVQYQTIAMETTYYDAPGGALSARHITLRRRMENGTSVCTVKTPTATLARGEWECQCGNIEDGILELCKLGAPKELLVLTADGVAPICGAKFTRRAGLIQCEGATVELALDSGILLGGGKEIPLCEVEAELKSGKPEAVIAFGKALAERFGLTVQHKSKFRRALALAKGE